MVERRRSASRAAGRSSPVGPSSPSAGAASGAGSGSAASLTSTRRRWTATRRLAPVPSREQTTRAIYRLLVLRGLAPDEATNLIAYVCGLPLDAGLWTLPEINRLLFLQALARAGRWGARDGVPRGSIHRGGAGQVGTPRRAPPGDPTRRLD
jgi:hypothetical protein